MSYPSSPLSDAPKTLNAPRPAALENPPLSLSLSLSVFLSFTLICLYQVGLSLPMEQEAVYQISCRPNGAPTSRDSFFLNFFELGIKFQRGLSSASLNLSN